jgi:ATP-binding protein involved in chromosome partitioning
VTSREEILRRIDEVPFPGFRHGVVRLGLVKNVTFSSGEVVVELVPSSRKPDVVQEIGKGIDRAVRTLDGVQKVRIVAPGGGPEHPTASNGEGIPGVRRIIAVSSAKGGVGKSTVAVNLAVSLRRTGAKVALMDADVYGPSAPLMFGAEGRPRTSGQRIAPIERYGVSIMSMGFFLDDSSPVIWRGPMVMGLIRQFVRDVDWGEQDYLVVDMPPGTGDAALTLAQQVPISGAVIVTTPQGVALADVQRGIGMFRQLNVPVLGIVENMSYYECPDCGEREEIFGSGGGASLAKQFGTRLLAEIPLVPEIRKGGDAGTPISAELPDHPVSQAFAKLASEVEAAVESAARSG